MTESLSKLIAEGLPTARISFGEDGPAKSAEHLAFRGTRMFGGSGVTTVAALLTNDRRSVELLLGAMIAGVELASLPMPARAADPQDYLNFVRSVCRSIGAERIVARDDTAPLLGGVAVEVVPHRALGSVKLAAPTGDGFRLVQFSSGSTSRPKGVRLSDALLGMNVEAILESVGPRTGDTAVSWLPLSHDMGLIGMLMSTIVASGPSWTDGCDLALIEPEAFLRKPSAWLDVLDRRGGTFTAAPDFGFRLASSRRPPRSLDLSPLRCAIVGGEVVRASTMQSVQNAFGAMGMTPEALCPAYGMAEIGLAAAMTPPSEHWQHLDVDAVALADGEVSPRRPHAPPLRLVASGVPLQGYSVVPAGGPRTVAPLRVGAPAIGDDALTGRSFAGPLGFLESGDVGFIVDGRVYVTGRGDDYVVAGARNLYAPGIEEAVSGVEGVRAGRVTAVGLPDGQWILVVEAARPEPLTDLELVRLRTGARRAALEAASSVPDEVLVAARGTLPLTSSGKLQRHEVRNRWLKRPGSGGGSSVWVSSRAWCGPRPGSSWPIPSSM